LTMSGVGAARAMAMSGKVAEGTAKIACRRAMHNGRDSPSRNLARCRESRFARETAMRLTSIAKRLTLALLLAAGAAGHAFAQGAPLKDQLVGVWSFVSSTSQRDDGSNTWGPGAKGQLVFTANGRFSFQLMRGDRPRYKSGTRMRGSIIENQATSRGTLSYFGTYSVNENDRTLSFNIESSSFPNLTDATQKRIITIAGDELRYQNPAPARGTTPTTQVWRRLK
jgi:hypothetical protein